MMLYRRISIRFCAVCALVFVCLPLAAQSNSGAIVLSGASLGNSHPAVAASQDGRHVFVVWDGLVSGHRRILMREAVENVWLNEVIVDAHPSADNHAAVVDVDAAGNPHVAWLARDNGSVRPKYAFRAAGEWVLHSLPVLVPGDCDYVTLKLDDQGLPWLAWQTGKGSVYSILSGTLGETGQFKVEDLTPGSANHNLLPEILFDPEPNVLWYTARDDEFFLVGEKFDRSTQQWGDVKLSYLDALPAEPLPHLLKKADGPLAALWYERAIGASGEASASDRILMGEQNPVTNGAGIVIDEQPNATNRLVSGAAVGNRIVAVWCSETLASGSIIFAGYGESAASVVTAQVSGSETSSATNPRVSPVGNTGAGVVWQGSTGTASGDQHIFYRQLRL